MLDPEFIELRGPEFQVPEKIVQNRFTILHDACLCKSNSVSAYSSARKMVCIDASEKESTIGLALPSIVEDGHRPPCFMEGSMHTIVLADERGNLYLGECSREIIVLLCILLQGSWISGILGLLYQVYCATRNDYRPLEVFLESINNYQ